MKYASVCSGVEAPSQAWESLGWEAQWFSEIEDFPSKVLAHHYPNVPNLGDMTKLINNEVFNARDIQLLIGGTPCQSFSVAGLRKGLEDPRGNLALEFVRILSIKKPKWFIWENVPGVLSSSGGRDFASIIGAFTKIGYGVSWRVLDAQFFGVPQRRRRVFVVGYFGNWRPSWRVLFESQSLPGDTKAGRKKREGFTREIKGSPYFSKQAIGEYKSSGLSSTLAVRDSRGPEDLITQSVSENQRAEVLLTDKSGTLKTGGGKPGQGYPCVFRYSKSHRATHVEARAENDGTTNTLSTGDGGGNQSSQNLVVNHLNDDRVVGTLAASGAGLNRAAGQCNELDFCIMDEATSQGGVKTNCLPASYGEGGADYETKPLVFLRGIRRLTPLECERLQGFKDNWTNIPGATNSKRYKACGNSMAVPVIKWLGERIQKIEAEGRG